MAYFIARLCLSNSFAADNIEKMGGFWREYCEMLPAEASAELFCERFTFGFLRVAAPTGDECRQMLERTWREKYPDEKTLPRIMICEDDGGDQAKLMGSIYFSYYGIDEYLSLVTELYPEIPLLRERGALRALRMQNYLVAIDQGCGFTTILASFGDFLRRMNVYDDGERELYTEYIVHKQTDGERACANDIIEELSDDDSIAENGVIGIDIGYYLEGENTDELRRFIKRLYALQDKYVFVFRVPFLEKKALERISDALSDLMLLKTVAIPPLHESALLENFWDTLRRHGYMTDKSIIAPFFARVSKEKKDGRFYGFKTVEKIAQEMILEKAKSVSRDMLLGQNADKQVITADDVSDLSEKDSREKSGYDLLDELIGMEEISKRVREIVSQVKLSLSDQKLDRPCIHMRFLGSPGTGKTTVARIIGQIFREEGILRKGSFMEYSARSLCAEYVGQTAVRTASICRDSYGSVLFLDEAYALYDNDVSTNDYGKEALATLISEMENHRDDMLVIMAGYTDDMETLMKGNAGLRSRMPYAITFNNYSRDELFEIFMMMVKKHFSYSDEFEAEAKKFFKSLSDGYIGSKEFANARFVRNLYERTWSKGALRASLSGERSVELIKDDFVAASSEKEFSEKIDQRPRIGFR